ncbi:MAG: DUF364 domain-containing protein [Thermodesulfobacteriota bacterium]
MADDIHGQLREKFARICREQNLMDQNVQVKARTLTVEEAIGNPEADDFPLQQGKERLMQADFLGSSGQAFTDRFGNFEGALRDIIDSPLTNNFRRAVFVATLNAVLKHLGRTDRTLHCRDREPVECASELARFIEKEYGRAKVVQIGFQPAMVEAVSRNFPYRILDLDPENIGMEKRGARIEGPDATADALAWADLLLVTGTTIVNGTVDQFLTGKPVLFYGTTIAGAAALMGWKRFCARGK